MVVIVDVVVQGAESGYYDSLKSSVQTALQLNTMTLLIFKITGAIAYNFKMMQK